VNTFVATGAVKAVRPLLAALLNDAAGAETALRAALIARRMLVTAAELA
jgi:hypothetical protein